METTQWMICEICREQLNSYTSGANPHDVIYRHPTRRHYDHEPKPIPRTSEQNVRHICDFCGRDGVEFVFHTAAELQQDIVTPIYGRKEVREPFARYWDRVKPDLDGFVHHYTERSSTGWAACRPCAQFIDRRDVERLITYLRRLDPDTFASVPRNRLRELYRPVIYNIRETNTVDPDTGREIPAAGPDNPPTGPSRPDR